MNKPELSKKKPLTPEQTADAARLLALWEAWQQRTKAEGKKAVTQGEFGYRYDVGSQGMVWQYLHGRSPLNMKAAMAFAVAMDCRIEDISPDLATLAKAAGEAATNPPPAQEAPPPVRERPIPQTAVRHRLREHLPEDLQGFASPLSNGAEGVRIFYDYLSPKLHAEVVYKQATGSSRAIAASLLLFTLEDGPANRVFIEITSEADQRPLHQVFIQACARMGVETHVVRSIPEAAALITSLEFDPAQYGDDYEIEPNP